MINIQDLHFKNEILPLFDFVHNEFSKDALLQLLSEMPDSVGEIYERQHIIKGLLKNPRLYTSFAYSKIEFNQVYRYIEDKKNHGIWLTGHSWKIYFLFNPSERNRERSGLVQLFIFLYKVGNFYFSSLDLASFPEPFRNRLKNINRMMADLEVEKFHEIVRRRQLSITEIAGLNFILKEKIGNGEMDIFWKDFFLFEAWFSVSKGIRKYRFAFPEFSDKALTIIDFYHPLLKNPVKNSLTAPENVTLITGPNMSGKSTLLKSIGLCVYLAHLGLAVPAQKCELPFFDMISVAINLNDDLKSGYSHFMSEIKTLKKVVTEARSQKRCFAIFDELFIGTNTEDALALSETTILGLTAFPGSYFFISTHLHQLLKALDFNAYKISAGYIECDLEKGMPVFTYRLRPGWSGLKIGQIIFEQEGLNELLGRRT